MKIPLLPLIISATLLSYGCSEDNKVKKSEKVSSQYEKHSVEYILKYSDDQELVKLSGEIVRKITCNTYLFRDETGEIQIEIADHLIPQKGLIFNFPIIIKGELEPASDENAPTVDVDKVRYYF